MSWEGHVVGPARKELERAPKRDRERILEALREMEADPFRGDIARLKGLPVAWRRRVGSFRILFDLYPEKRLVVVQAIRRRSITTYRD